MNRKKCNTKGFTLAELLIVVAIIAVLVAVAIPVFTTQLEKAREATDIANMRSAVAAVKVAVLSGVDSDGNQIDDGAEFLFNPSTGMLEEWDYDDTDERYAFMKGSPSIDGKSQPFKVGPWWDGGGYLYYCSTFDNTPSNIASNDVVTCGGEIIIFILYPSEGRFAITYV